MQKKHLWLAVAISASSMTATAVELTAEIAPGYDDNPFRLADRFDSDNNWFLNTKVKLEHKVDKIRLRGQFENRDYDGATDDADTFAAKLDARYKTKYELAGKKAMSYVKVEYKHKDKTYVIRSTGLVGTYTGRDISDRYDYDQWGVDAKTTVSLNKALDVGLQLKYKNKDYEDYNITGLSNLDYEQVSLTNDWLYAVDKQSKVGVALNVAKRDFDNKREKDFLNNRIAGTDLKYDYWSISTTYERDITKNLEASFLYFYEERRGSGNGYYDIDESRASAKLRYKANDSLKFTGKIAYQDREYRNAPIVVANEDLTPSTEGYTIELGMEKEMAPISDFSTALVAGIRYDEYDSINASYEYDRTQVYAGVKVGFGK